MTKKDYELIAPALAQAYSEAGASGMSAGVELAEDHLVHALQFENPRFKPGMFKKFIEKLTSEL